MMAGQRTYPVSCVVSYLPSHEISLARISMVRGNVCGLEAVEGSLHDDQLCRHQPLSFPRTPTTH